VTLAPKYERIVVDLDARLGRGEWRPGALLPSEDRLARNYDVSRITIRHALSVLELQGKLRRHQGRATQVASKLTRHLVPLRHFDADMKAQGITFRRELTTFRVQPVAPEICDSLHLARDQQALYLQEVRYIDDTPYSAAERYVHPRFASGVTREAVTSKYGVLRGHVRGGCVFDVTMDVRACQPTVARALGLKPSSLVFVYRSLGRIRRGQRPFEIVDSYYPLDRWKFALRMRLTNGRRSSSGRDSASPE
jgi:GntR family transcriptional regulator